MNTHIVKAGETLGTIAKKYFGVADRYKEILMANPQITNANLIRVGQVINIPSVKTVSVSQIPESGMEKLKGFFVNNKRTIFIGALAVLTAYAVANQKKLSGLFKKA